MSVRPSIRPVGIFIVLTAAFGLLSCKSDNATRSPDLPPPKLKAFTFTCTTTGGDTTEPHTIQVSQNQAQGLCTASCVYTVVNRNGEQVDQQGCVDFSCRSRDNGIATVTNVNQNPAQCDVRGVAPGNVNIVATVDGGIGSREFNVQAQQASSIALNCTANETIPGGASRQYQATATFPDNSTQNVTTQATWSVVPDNANPDFVDVNQSGLVTTRNVAANSPATVTAVFQNQTASCNFTVVPATITRVCVEPDDGTTGFFFGSTRPVTNGGNCNSPQVTLQLGSPTNSSRRYRTRVIFNSNQETDATLQADWSEVPDPTPVICVEENPNGDNTVDAGDNDCVPPNGGHLSGNVVATAIGGPVNVRAEFGGQNGTAPVLVQAGGGNQVLARNSLLVGNPLDTDGNGVRGEATDVPGKFFCVGYADLVGGLTRVPELPGNKQMTAVVRTCTAPLPADGNCVPCTQPLVGGVCPHGGGLSAPISSAAIINQIAWNVPQDRSFFDGNDCAATQTQSSFGNIPAARVGDVVPFPSATDPTDPTIKGNVTAIGAVRLGTACVRGVIGTPGGAVGTSDSDGATALVLPVTNDVVLENANQDAVQLCNTLLPLFELGLQNGPGAVTQLVSVLSDILNPLLTAIAQDQTGGGPIPTDDLIDQLTAGLGTLTEPLLQALEELVQTVDSDVYAPVNCGLGTLLQALLGSPEQVEAIQECGP